MSHFEDGNDSDHRVMSTMETRSARIIGLPGGRNRLANRAPATTPTALKIPSSRGNSPSKAGNIQQASSPKAMTEAMFTNFPCEVRKLLVLRMGRGRQAVSTARKSGWSRRPDFVGCWKTVDGGPNRRSVQGSVWQLESSRTVPCRTTKSKAN